MIVFGTLLWIDEKNHSAPNNKNKTIASYFRQINLLAKTLRLTEAVDLHVFTNSPEKIAFWFASKKQRPPVLVQIHSDLVIPDGTAFYSAHHKLDALRAASQLLSNEADRFVLLDTDVVALNGLTLAQKELLNSSDLVVYDISDQVFPAYGQDVIARDLNRIANAVLNNARWFGGEFIAGSRSALRKLVHQCDECLPRYFSALPELHHKGDEMFVSAALNILREKTKLKIVIQNPFKLISRHWSRFSAPPLTEHAKHAFVHCPGSKMALEFLSLWPSPKKEAIFYTLSFYQRLVLTYQTGKRARAYLKRLFS